MPDLFGIVSSVSFRARPAGFRPHSTEGREGKEGREGGREQGIREALQRERKHGSVCKVITQDTDNFDEEI